MNVLNVVQTNTRNQNVRQNEEEQLGFEKALSALIDGDISKHNLSGENEEIDKIIENIFKESDNLNESEDDLLVKLLSLSKENENQLDQLISQLVSNMLVAEIEVKADVNTSNMSIENIEDLEDLETIKSKKFSEFEGMISNVANDESKKLILDSIKLYSETRTLNSETSTLDSETSTLDSENSTLDSETSTLDSENNTSDSKNSTLKNLSKNESEMNTILINNLDEKLTDSVAKMEIPKEIDLKLDEVKDSKKAKKLMGGIKKLVTDNKKYLKLSEEVNEKLNQLNLRDQRNNEYLYISEESIEEQVINKSKNNSNIDKVLEALIKDILVNKGIESEDIDSKINAIENIDILNKVEKAEVKDKLLKLLNIKIDNDNLVNKKDNLLVYEKQIKELKNDIKSSDNKEVKIISNNSEQLINSVQKLVEKEFDSKDQLSKLQDLTNESKVRKSTDKTVKSDEKIKLHTIQTINSKGASELKQKTSLGIEEVDKSNVVQKVIESIEYDKNSFSENIKIQLKPKELGKLELEVIRKNGKFEASIIVETDEAKSIIKNKSNLLVAAFERKNMQLSDLKMIVRKQNTGNTNFNFSSNSGDNNQQFQNKHINYYTSEINNMQNSDSDMLSENIQDSTSNYKYYGNSVNIFV